MRYYLVLDVGTTGIKAFVFSQDLKIAGRAYERIGKTRPHPGWVEQSPQEIVAASIRVLRGAVRASRLPLRQIRACGMSNQRETTVVWNGRNDAPVYPAIVWEDKRTVKECARMRREKLEPLIRRKTGLTIDPYFSATKLSWILKHCPSPPPSPTRGEGVSPQFPSPRGRGDALNFPRPAGEGGGEGFRFGTIDTWVLWNLVEGKPHLTDWTNASRTLLYNIHTLEWDKDLLNIFNVPREILPSVRPSQSNFGMLREEIIGARLPVYAVCGDQQSSMYGVGVRKGTTKITYGTGTFLMQSLGSTCLLKRPFFTTLMPRSRKPKFALEAKIEESGSTVDQVLHDPLKLKNALARIAKNADVYLKKLPITPKQIVVDGGITRDGIIVSLQEKISGVKVRRQSTDEGTALGIAKLLRDSNIR